MPKDPFSRNPLSCTTTRYIRRVRRVRRAALGVSCVDRHKDIMEAEAVFYAVREEELKKSDALEAVIVSGGAAPLTMER